MARRIDWAEFKHKTIERFLAANSFHYWLENPTIAHELREKINYPIEDPEQLHKGIAAAKELFQGFLADIVRGEYEAPCAGEQYDTLIVEGLRRSEIDWNDEEAVLSFCTWYQKRIADALESGDCGNSSKK